MNMENTIKLGILGFGGMGHWHSENAPKIDGVEVIAVHDIDKSRLIDGKKRGFRAYESRAEFLADPDINLVLVATPNHIHKEFSIEALRAGKNVICEKPVTLSVSELDEIIKVSEEESLLFTVHQNRRWDRDYRVMKKIVEDNRIGKVFSIESRVYGNNGKIYGWRQEPEFGGGMVLDWGVHLLDHFTFMFPNKKIVSVYTQLFSLINPRVDDLFKVDLTFEDGLSVHVEVGTFGLKPMPRFFGLGDLGSFTIDDFSGTKGGIKTLSHRLDEMGQVIINTPAGPTRTMAPQPEECFMESDLPVVTEDWTDLYKNLVGVLNKTQELIVTPATVRRTMVLIEAVFESAKRGKSLKVSI